MGNGAVTRDVVFEICEAVDPSLAGWVAADVSFVSTVVDRITPSTLIEDLALVERAIGREDRAAVVAEPFSEWVLAGEFPAGRPDWVSAGARLVTDVAPFAERKLGLLNGGHSLLAYAGSSLGHSTVAGAVADPRCRAWLEEWWDAVAGVLPLPADEVARYRLALLDRWTNPRISHALSAVARDGSLKLVQRVLPVIHRYRAIGEPPPPGAARILGAWLAHLRGSGAAISDPRATELVRLAAGERSAAARALLDALEPGLGADRGLAREVAVTCQELEGRPG
jgi:fructuronate reductase